MQTPTDLNKPVTKQPGSLFQGWLVNARLVEKNDPIWQRAQVERRAVNDIIQQVTGKRPQYCRPPGGQMNPAVLRAATEEGLTTTLWTVDPGDYANPGEDLFERTL